MHAHTSRVSRPGRACGRGGRAPRDGTTRAQCSAEASVHLRPRQLQLTQQSLTLHGKNIKLIAPADIDAVMDMYIQAGQNDRDPYWCRPWPSGIALADLLLRRSHLVAGYQVGDLGAGLGIAGIAAAVAGAQSVVLLDREPLALQCGLESARASGISAAALVQGADAAQMAAVLPFPLSSPLPAPSPPHPAPSAPTPTDAPTPTHPQYTSYPTSISGQDSRVPTIPANQLNSPTLTAQTFDWSQPHFNNRVDVLLACDVLYEGTAVEPIARLVPQLLKPGGYLLLADPPERTPHNRHRFLEELQKAVQVVTLEEESLESCHVQDTSQEMISGACIGDTIPVQFMVFRCSW